jgi:hypothetical protein
MVLPRFPAIVLVFFGIEGAAPTVGAARFSLALGCRLGFGMGAKGETAACAFAGEVPCRGGANIWLRTMAVFEFNVVTPARKLL